MDHEPVSTEVFLKRGAIFWIVTQVLGYATMAAWPELTGQTKQLREGTSLIEANHKLLEDNQAKIYKLLESVEHLIDHTNDAVTNDDQ